MSLETSTTIILDSARGRTEVNSKGQIDDAIRKICAAIASGECDEEAVVEVTTAQGTYSKKINIFLSLEKLLITRREIAAQNKDEK